MNDPLPPPTAPAVPEPERNPEPVRERIALGIRQPWCELILRGRKTLEIRSRPTQVRGTIYVYSAKKLWEEPELTAVLESHELDPDPLPKGLLVGTVEIVGCRRTTPADGDASRVPGRFLRDAWAWELADPVRFAQPLKPRFLPYGVWFYPFKRRGDG